MLLNARNARRFHNPQGRRIDPAPRYQSNQPLNAVSVIGLDVLIELKLGRIGTGTTRSGPRSAESGWAIEYNVFSKQLAHLGGCGLTGFP